MDGEISRRISRRYGERRVLSEMRGDKGDKQISGGVM
jgi:hypothetical protein